MGAIPRSGSLTQTSPLPGEQAPVKVTDILDRAPFVKRPAVEQNALNTAAYMDTTRALTYWTTGHRFYTTMFVNNNPHVKDVRSHIADQSNERHNNDTSYTRINNYPMMMANPWSYSYDNESGEQEISGEALCFPGIDVNIADVFFTDIGNNQQAKFVVTSVTPLTWRTEALTRITFGVSQTEDVDTLFQNYIDMSTEERFFSDTAYRRGAGVVLLETRDFRHLQLIKEMRTIISKAYFSRFFDADTGTVLCPDVPYDPFIAKFVSLRVPWSVVKKKPMVLIPSAEAIYENSIWGRMGDSHYLSPVDGVWRRYYGAVHSMDSNATGFNGMINRPYTMITEHEEIAGSETADGYLFSPLFYNGNRELIVDGLEQLVWDTLSRRYTNVAGALVFINGFQSLSKPDFYRKGPVLMWLCDVAINQLESNPPGAYSGTSG